MFVTDKIRQVLVFVLVSQLSTEVANNIVVGIVHMLDINNMDSSCESDMSKIEQLKETLKSRSALPRGDPKGLIA